MSSNSGSNPLLDAVRNGRYNDVKSLLNGSADVNVRDGSGRTPLMMAANNGDCRMARLLLENNADVNMADHDGTTGLMLFVQSFAVLIEADITFLDQLISRGADVNRQNDQGNTAVMLASIPDTSLSRIVIDTLVKAGADVNLRNNENQSALSVLVSKQNLTTVGTLLHHGAKFSQRDRNKDVVHLMVYYGKVNLIPLAIAKGAYPFLLHKEEWLARIIRHDDWPEAVSPLVVALYQGDSRMANYFIKIRFLTKFDVTKLPNNKTLKEKCITKSHQETSELPAKIFPSVFSLFNLCLIQVLEMLGNGPGREERVNALPLPVPVKQQLLFKNGQDLDWLSATMF